MEGGGGCPILVEIIFRMFQSFPSIFQNKNSCEFGTRKRANLFSIGAKSKTMQPFYIVSFSGQEMFSEINFSLFLPLQSSNVVYLRTFARILSAETWAHCTALHFLKTKKTSVCLTFALSLHSKHTAAPWYCELEVEGTSGPWLHPLPPSSALAVWPTHTQYSILKF